jgi:hypothetical protein
MSNLTMGSASKRAWDIEWEKAEKSRIVQEEKERIRILSAQPSGIDPSRIAVGS